MVQIQLLSHTRDQLKVAGMTIDDSMFVEVFLRSLTPFYSDALPALFTAPNMSVTEVFKALTHFRLQRESMTYGKGLASTDNSNRSAAYMSEAYPRSKYVHRDWQYRFRSRKGLRCGNCGGRFHTENTCRKPPVGQAKNKAYHNPTTFSSQPPRSEQKLQHSVTVVSADTSSHAAPTSPRNNEKDVIDLKIDTDIDESLYQVDSDNESLLDWYLDTGATSHVCNNPKLFRTYTPFTKPE
ncbi:hypothetical protein V1517DRAFT_332890 [Lipomyces orientalis]|uniref:Uncharacterized protein n=1 Tax=Lipomyces orientalis TaxID=1233043 RepID=A0ACC3TDQ6_9ASCO